MKESDLERRLTEGERFRLTAYVMANGQWGFSIIGLHTTFEAIGFLHTIISMMEDRAKNDKQTQNLIKELVRGS